MAMFQTDTDALSQQYDKFLVSRVVPSDLNTLIEVQVPTELPASYSVEINLYSLFDNSLIYNIVANSDTPNQFFSETLQYGTQGTRRLLFIDFSKIELNLLDVVPDGELLAVLSFFANEIGSSESRILTIREISPSRREVELALLPEYNTDEQIAQLLETSRPQINAASVMQAVQQLFGRPTTPIQSDNTVFDYGFVTGSDEFPAGLSADVITQIQNITNTILTASYHRVTQSINQQLGAPNNRNRFTDIYLHDIISQSISASYAPFASATPSQFDLI